MTECHVVKLNKTLSLDVFVKLKVNLCSVMNGFKKRSTSVVRLARARNKSIKKDYLIHSIHSLLQ